MATESSEPSVDLSSRVTMELEMEMNPRSFDDMLIDIYVRYKNRQGVVLDFSYMRFDYFGTNIAARLREGIECCWAFLNPIPDFDRLSQDILRYAQQVYQTRGDINGGVTVITASMEGVDERLPQVNEEVAAFVAGLQLQVRPTEANSDQYLGQVCNDVITVGLQVRATGDQYYGPANRHGLGITVGFQADGRRSWRRRRRGLNEGEISRLKQETFESSGDGDDESVVCSICVEELLPGVKIMPLPCSHTFHHNCIATWLERRPNCPLCRSHINPV